MELKINDIVIPEKITFNFEELKAELQESVKKYETVVYTEDQVKIAKADKAALNKLKKALNDERIRREREYMQPFNEFKAKINEIISIIDKPLGLIDKQVKKYDEVKKTEKAGEIEKLFNNIDKIPEWLHLEMIFNPKWLNATVSLKTIAAEINKQLDKVNSDLEILRNLPEFAFEATEVYKTTLDINRAVNEGKRLAEIQKKKVEAENKKPVEVQPAPDQKKVEKTEPALANWINFSAKLTVAQAVELRDFFNSRNIEFKAIGG
jgi:hypothetical protein